MSSDLQIFINDPELMSGILWRGLTTWPAQKCQKFGYNSNQDFTRHVKWGKLRSIWSQKRSSSNTFERHDTYIVFRKASLLLKHFILQILN